MPIRKLIIIFKLLLLVFMQHIIIIIGIFYFLFMQHIIIIIIIIGIFATYLGKDLSNSSSLCSYGFLFYEPLSH